MKKLFAIFLTLTLLWACIGCGAKTSILPDPPPAPAPAQTQAKPAGPGGPGGPGGVEVLPVEGAAAAPERDSGGHMPALPALPPAEADAQSQFGVDKHINIHTIDQYLGRNDVCYRDVRMLMDPGDYAAIGGDPAISATVEGFEVTPYPYLANLTGLPEPVAETAYAGKTLYTLTWDESGAIQSATPNYMESEMVINDLFPKDTPIFLMCGGGGYAAFTKALLIELGYDASLLYNIGGFWEYDGARRQYIAVSYGEHNASEYYAMHRLKYHLIDFGYLTPVEN